MAAAHLRPLVPLATGVRPTGKPELPIKCLLCDLYGTLFISASGDIGTTAHQEEQTARLHELLDRNGLAMPPSEVIQRLHLAIEAVHARLHSKGVDFPEVVIETVWQEVLSIKDVQQSRDFAMEFEMIMNPVWHMPGIESLLATCRSRNIALGIISNAQFFTPYLFNWLLHASPAALGFDPELTYYSYVHEVAKPSPILFEMARKQLQERGIENHHVAFIGNDMRNDILPARHVGFQTILFAGDARSFRLRAKDPLCSQTQPDMVITALSQLERFIQ